MEMKLACLMTSPRYGAYMSINTIHAALRSVGIPLTCSGGVYYGQCMQRMMEQVVNDGEANIILTLDGDTMPTGKHINALLSRMAGNPHIDALAALQARRGMAYPLLTVGKETEVQFDGRAVEVTTAHFGLTAIRVESLKKVPKPWFYGKPNDQGEWEHGRIDDDIWFWFEWRKAGNNVHVDPNVSIGHLEEVVAYFDENGQHQFAYPMDYLAMVNKCTS